MHAWLAEGMSSSQPFIHNWLAHEPHLYGAGKLLVHGGKFAHAWMMSSPLPHLAHGPHLHDVGKLLVHDAQRELALANPLQQRLLLLLLRAG